MDFTDLSKLQEYLLDKIEKIMVTDVADVIKQEESRQIKRYYRQFTPKEYERREDNGGLSDIRNMKVKPRRYKHTVSVTITNDTRGNPKFSDNPTNDLDKVFATGLGYEYYGEDTYKYYATPRPANEDAVDELKGNRRIVSEIISGLKQTGIQCE